MTTERWIAITDSSITPQQLLDFVTAPQGGAVLMFLGTVRELTHGRRTVALDYEAYPEMALKILHELVDLAVERWPILKVAALHRLGHLEVTEISVALALSCAHRGAAFEAVEFLIDELKQKVPIWKKENWDDGSTEWVHPGLSNLPPREDGQTA